MTLAEVIFDFGKIGSQEIIVSVTGYIIVFAALLVLYLVFSNLSTVLTYYARKRCRDKGNVDCADEIEFNISGDVNAAISLALYLHFNDSHDTESGILTVKKVSKRYSPWSSKIYGVMNNQINR